MCDFSGCGLHCLDRANALRTVAAAGKGDEQHLAFFIEIEFRGSKDIGGGNCTSAAESGVKESSLQRVTYISRGAGTGHNNFETF